MAALRVASRSEWGATAPLGPPMYLPVSELWLHHSVTPVTADPFADMRTVERVGVQRFGRFSYSWAYHPSGLLLEGAGDTIGAHTANHNSTSLGLVLIGNYEDSPVSDEMVADLREAIRILIDTNRLTPGTYPTGGHRDLKQTACPGAHAYARLDDIRAAAPTPPQETDMGYGTVYRNVDDGSIAFAAPGIWEATNNPDKANFFVATAHQDVAVDCNSLQWQWSQDLALSARVPIDADALAQRIASAVDGLDVDEVKAAVKAALREGSG